MFGSNVWACALGRMAGARVVVCHEHTWSYEGRPLRRFLDRELIGRFADAFVAVSAEDRRRMIEIEGVRPEVIRYIANGGADPTPPSGADVRAELGIPARASVIGSVGHLRHQKAYWVLVRAVERLRVSHPEVRALIAGDSSEDHSVAPLIAELGLQNHVLLLGRREDVADVIAALDVAVCCSDFEGMPLSVLEYMEGAKPVVATRVGGVPDVVVDGVTGLLVERRDPVALGDAVAELLDHPDRALEMGLRGHERRYASFDLNDTVARIGGPLCGAAVGPRRRREPLRSSARDQARPERASSRRRWAWRCRAVGLRVCP